MVPEALIVLGWKPFVRGQTHPFFFTQRGILCWENKHRREENLLDIITRPTKRRCDLRQIQHLQRMEVRGKRSLLVALARGWPQNTRCVKQRASGNHGVSSTAGAQNHPPCSSGAQGHRGSEGSCWDTARKAKSLAQDSHGHGDPSADLSRRTRIWLAHKQGRLSSPRAGLESLPPVFNIFNCSQSRAGCKAGGSPCSAHRAAPSHCPHTKSVPEPSCRPGSSNAADPCKSRYPSACDWGTAGMRGVSALGFTEASTCNVVPLSRDNPHGVSEFVSVTQIQATELRTRFVPFCLPVRFSIAAIH